MTLEQYWESKRAVWSTTTYSSEYGRYSVLVRTGFPKAGPQTVFNKLKDKYRRSSLKQIFIRARKVEAQVYHTSFYETWMLQNPEAFRGSYVAKERNLSMNEVMTIYNTAKALYPHTVNAVCLMAFAGLRKHEAKAALSADFISKDVLFVRGKGRKNRSAPLLPGTRELLLSPESGPYLCSKNGKPLNKPERSFTALSEKSGVIFTPHDLRAFYLTHCAERLNIFELHEISGHESIETTKRYVRTSRDVIYKKLGGANEQQGIAG